ncbi:MAG: hypothetical protein JEZ09_12035 [Salinivirgaceae bacterium]|nr:hypothetical protein [Salinivirgaceae bacterium]
MKRYILIICIQLISILMFSQGAIKKKRQLSEKVFFGGGFGMQFGSVNVVEVSPMVGYKPIENLYFGLKGTYQYYKRDIYNISTDIYGGSFFGLLSIFSNIAIYSEYEMLSLESSYFDFANMHTGKARFWEKSLLLGGGFVQPIGERSNMLLLVLWNLNDSPYSPYINPIIRITYLY